MCKCVCWLVSVSIFFYASLWPFFVNFVLFWFVFMLSNFILLLSFLVACFCSNERERKGVDSGGWRVEQDLGRVGGGEILIRIYCIKKIYFQFLKSTTKQHHRELFSLFSTTTMFCPKFLFAEEKSGSLE